VPKKTRDIHWARPELVAEIEVAEMTASGKIRQGSFKGLRLDRTPEDLKAEEAPSLTAKLRN
jgi:bifunctional non-homologous end joining protein LigD